MKIFFPLSISVLCQHSTLCQSLQYLTLSCVLFGREGKYISIWGDRSKLGGCLVVVSSCFFGVICLRFSKNFPKAPNSLAWTWESKCCQLTLSYSPSSRSPNLIPAYQWEGTSLRCSLAQLHPSIPVAKSLSCFGKESSRIGISLQSSLILAKRHGWLH